MNPAEIIHFATQALTLVLFLSLPPILVAAFVGTLVSLIQALTQVQEQTLGFVVKLIAVIITLFVTAQWLGAELHSFATLTLDKIPQIR
ncbi:type III secretion system export apparatus subunit SctS [Vibrio sp. 10N.222.54.F12]|jgi:type III secretion protein S|uniref:Type III secretion inner membrane protein (YscS,homologous to flagellar export components) n=5 Tax=Vibrio TaxID=662 RepID=A0A0H4A232_9VIBR|nr:MULTISPECIES: type III secretion system export apparatus subunit SctS [Vibrio]AKN39560.1 Type III secretion inner membrane protein (YscS,homologous to flagellar export components) [Vibrio splendidus]AKN40259.1 Type III secretion inner membrane protein (YscS,homologous to flagellar export components) [Vibrio tasmaniensis]MDP2503805.1 type III secretion system export apparatus subunit SctS [Vibrio splendidus]OEF57772.1 EscS/YscS/HrcS family type III secretion system export apparatus protein [V